MINLKTNINFIKNGLYIFIASILIMLASCLLIFFKGLNLGIDFTKGTRFDIVITDSSIGSSHNIKVEDMESIMDNLNLKGQYTIKELNSESTSYNKERMFSIVSQLQFDKNKIIDQINKIENLEYNDDKSLYQTIGPKMGSELATSAKWSLGIALILISIYIHCKGPYSLLLY